MNRALFISDFQTMVQTNDPDRLPEVLADYVEKIPVNPGHSQTEVTVTQDKIIWVCTSYFSTSFDRMVARDNSDEMAYIRQVTIYLLCRRTRLKTRTIANLFERDRSTISHSRSKIADLMKVDISVREEVERLNASL